MEDPGSAIWAVIIMIIILTIVMVFFCMVPVYKALEKRWNHWDDLENDPRWNADSFQFSPTSPQMARAGGLSNNKYNRLSTCGSLGGNSGSSRSGSFRNKCALPRAEDQVEIKMPPAYADIFAASGTPEAEDTGSMGSPPAYYSNSPSPQEAAGQPPQVVVQVATPPQAGPVKKTPVVPTPKPEDL
jgi:hypothetical protein